MIVMEPVLVVMKAPPPAFAVPPTKSQFSILMFASLVKIAKLPPPVEEDPPLKTISLMVIGLKESDPEEVSESLFIYNS